MAWSPAFLATVAFVSAIWGLAVAPAQAQSESAQVIIAQSMYDRGDFQEAAETLERLLRRGRPAAEDRLTAGVILARSFTQLGKQGAAQQAFLGVLRQNPEWKPEPNWPANERGVARAAAVEFAVRQAEGLEETPTNAVEQGAQASPDAGDNCGKWWIWPAAGAIAIGGLLAALL